jgi:hypothetical protein
VRKLPAGERGRAETDSPKAKEIASMEGVRHEANLDQQSDWAKKEQPGGC